MRLGAWNMCLGAWSQKIVFLRLELKLHFVGVCIFINTQNCIQVIGLYELIENFVWQPESELTELFDI